VQLVLASATLRAAVRKFLFLETKWLSQVPGDTLTIEGTQKTDRREDIVRHYGLFVNIAGNIRNVVDSEEDPTDSITSMGEFNEFDEHDGEEVSESVGEAPSGTPTSISSETREFKFEI
jgi:hypothetical protein